MPDDTVLCWSPRITVATLKALIVQGDKDAIADFIAGRFHERYFDPIDSLPRTQKNGFSIMALCCLTIEALRCFHEGRATSERKSREIFERFFQQTDQFASFLPLWLEFYKDVRCGILHQSETTHGWRIRRSGPLLEVSTLTINATAFHVTLRKVLEEYTRKLKQADFSEKLWIDCKVKLNSIIANCEP